MTASRDRLAGPPSLVRRYGLAVYWALFALLAINGARHPGFVRDPDAVAYPWTEVAVICAGLAVAVAILQAILRPATFHGEWRRIGVALLYALLLLPLSAMLLTTDMAGHVYVPGIFALLTFLGVLVLAGATALARVVGRARRSSASTSI